MTRTGLTNFLVVASAVPAVLSVAFYARAPWWRSQVGQHLFTYMSIVALMLLLACVPLVWKPPPLWFGDVYLGCFGLFMVVTWWRLALILWEQQSGMRRHRREMELLRRAREIADGGDESEDALEP